MIAAFRKLLLLFACLATVSSSAAVAELARLRLTDGTMLRGDVELTRAQAVVHTRVGDACYPRDRVESVEWLEPAKSIEADAMRRLYALDPADVDGHFELAKWLIERKQWDLARAQCEYVLSIAPQHAGVAQLLDMPELVRESAKAKTPPPPTNKPKPARSKGIQPPPVLSKADILKLKLSEIELDGPPERLNVRFRRLRGERNVIELVRKEMSDSPLFDPRWPQILDRGQPHEKLQVVVKATGLKYADRIEVRSHPRAFVTYRRRVLPLIDRGCLRTGCHGGNTAYAFRFPAGSQTSDAYVYTSFALLDRLQTKHGPMINRELPEESALLRYLLPSEKTREPHVPTASGRVSPVLRGLNDSRYKTLVEWIDSLRSPHPDYQLEYAWPQWCAPETETARPPAPAAPPASAPAPNPAPGDQE